LTIAGPTSTDRSARPRLELASHIPNTTATANAPMPAVQNIVRLAEGSISPLSAKAISSADSYLFEAFVAQALQIT
jgi:hypothetical protein